MSADQRPAVAARKTSVAAKAARKPAQKAAAKKAAPKRAYHRGNVAEDLKEAALRSLKTHSLEELSARSLSREIGMAPANFYNHFPSMDYLLLDLAADEFVKREAANRRILARATSHDDAIIQIALGTVDFAAANPELFRVMFGQIGSRETHQRYLDAARASFAVLVEAALGDPPRGKRPFEAYALFAFINGLARVVAHGMVSDHTKTREMRNAFVENVTRAFLKA